MIFVYNVCHLLNRFKQYQHEDKCYIGTRIKGTDLEKLWENLTFRGDSES